ncbi:MAG TPA: aminotransferase class III-fold pyridoxal phosphate-dependent enzyme, partial [Pyrinomonadaceae bacterium]
RLADRLAGAEAPPLADIAFTLQAGRRAFARRAAVVCRDLRQAADALRGTEAGRSITAAQFRPGQQVVFVFPGQGAQFVNMGRELYEARGTFRHFVDECATLARPRVEFDLSRLLYPEPGSEGEAERQLAETVVTQLAVFTVEYALAQQLMDWGVKPSAMLGHSLGEYVAACLSGVFGLQAAVELVAERGRLMQGLPRGSMLAVSLGTEELQRAISAVAGGSAERLWVTAVNADHRSVAGGDNADVAALEEYLASRRVRTQRLATSHAFHTGMVEPILSAYGAFFDRLPKGKLHTPYVSNVDGGWADAEEVSTSRHWLRHMREPVQFSAGVNTLAAAGSWVWLEVGPGNALSRLVKYHLTTAQTEHGTQEVLTTLGEGAGDDVERLLRCLAQLWCYGAAVDWSQVRSDEAPPQRTGLTGVVTRAPEPRRPPHRVPLPTYPFERQSYWVQHTRRPNSVEAERAPDDVPDRTGAVVISAPPALESLAAARQAETRPAPDAAPGRRQLIGAELKSVVSAVSGVEQQALDAAASFFDLGFDSLLLLQISQGIKDRFGVEIAFRLLIEDYPSIEALTRHLDESLPADRFAPPPAEPGGGGPPAAQTQELWSAFIEAQRQALPAVSAQGAGETANAGVIRGLSELMLQQLRVLQSAIVGAPQSPALPRAATGAPDVTPDTPAATAAAVETRRNGSAAEPSHATPEAAAFGPWRPVNRSAAEGLTPAQHGYLRDFITHYTTRTAGSKARTQAHRAVLADTRVSAGFRQLWKEMVYPVVGRRSEGARIWDVDGNEYIDLNMGFGVNLLGHAPGFVVEALQEQLRDGIHIGPQSPLAGEVAALVCELTGMERAAFCNTGSEAVMAALRLARTVTGRTRVALFAGSYHGISDEVLVRGHGSDGELQAAPAALGIPPHAVREVLVLPYDQPGSLEVLRRRMHELAAVLVEPVQSSRPELQPREFLRELRRLTKEGGAALVFDEMITGFRIHPGGAQAWFGVQADLALYGKVVGGGMPIGVVAGKKAFMDAVDGGAWDYGDDSYPAANQTFFAGTFCKHPLAMAAARAMLTHLRERGPGLQAHLNERTADFVQALGELFRRLRAPMRVGHFGSLFRFMMAKELTHANLFVFHLLAKGIYVGDRAGFLSTAHTDRDVTAVLNAVEESIVELQRAGLFPPGSQNGGGPRRAPSGGDASAESHPAAAAPEHAPPAATTSEGVTSVPLTEAQTGLLALMQTGDDAARAYNECMTLRVSGELDLKALGTAFQSVVDRHEALRSVFNLEDGRQHIHAGLRVDVPVVDLSGLEDAGRERAARAFIEGQAARPFDLEKGPVVSLRVAKLGAQEHLLSLATHHIACDGLAFDYIVSELCACYAAARRGAPCDLPAPTQMSEYVAWQARHQDSAESSRARDYWLAQFSDRVPVVELPTDYPRPEVQSHSGRLERQAFEAALLEGLKRTAARQGCTMFCVLLSAYMLMIHWLSRQRDIVVGTPSAGQALMGGRNLIGYCINTLPIRGQIRNDLLLEEYVRSVRRRVLDAYEHQHYSFYRLVKDLRLLRDPSRHPLVSVSFNMDRVGARLRLDGLKMEIVDNPVVFSTFDLSWNVVESPQKLHVECTYNSDLFTPATSRGWMAAYEIILRAIAGPEPHTVRELLGLLTEAARRRRAARGQAFYLSRQETLTGIKRRGGGQA